MSIIEEFNHTIENSDEEDFIVFLKNLTNNERSQIINRIEGLWDSCNKRDDEHMNEYLKQYDNLREYHHSQGYKKYEQIRIRLQITTFICGKATYVNSDMCKLIYKYNILDYYFPTWLYQDEYGDFFSMHYYLQIKSKEHNCRTATKEETASALARFDFFNADTIFEITKNKHLWYLFRYECDIQNQYEGKGDFWIQLIVDLANSHKIERAKVAEECILSITRFSNKSITGYFFKMLEILNPTNEELLQLQDTLLQVLQSQHSKPINQTLKYLKRIHKDPSFNIVDFMEQVPLLLSWNIKVVVNGTLSLIDVLIRAYPQHAEALGLLCIQTLAQEDESLQIKAVKLLAKHKLLDNQTILDEIVIYVESLYHSTKALLPSMQQSSAQNEEIEITPPQYIREDNRIIYPKSFDEMVFFFSQVFEKNEFYDFDLFMVLLPNLKKLITEENINKLEPAFQRAIKSYANIHNEEVSSYSKIVSLMSAVFLEFAMFLIERFPSALQKVKKEYTELMRFFSTYGHRDGWNVVMELQEAIDYPKEMTNLTLKDNTVNVEIIPRKSFGYVESTQAQLLLKMLDSKFTFTLLSTPTHSPCWITLPTLINRIQNLKKDNIDIYPIDMQIALSRVLASTDSTNLSEIDKEFQNLFTYLFDNKPFDVKKMLTPEYWLVAILRKDNEDDAQIFSQVFIHNDTEENILTLPQWKSYRKPWEYEEWEKGVKVKKTIMYPKLTIERKHTIGNLPFESIFKHASISNHTMSSYDITYCLYLMPTIPRFILQNTMIHTSEHYSDAYVTKVLEGISFALINIWNHFGELEYLYVGYTLINEKKTVRSLASELWVKATQEGTMNHALLGRTLGKLEHNEYAPLKRLTDLLVSSMLNISTLHNQGLHSLLSAMIIRMNDEPIKGTKKLLEIYVEVLSLTGLDIPSETMEKLNVWGEVKSLKSVVNKIK